MVVVAVTTEPGCVVTRSRQAASIEVCEVHECFFLARMLDPDLPGIVRWFSAFRAQFARIDKSMPNSVLAQSGECAVGRVILSNAVKCDGHNLLLQRDVVAGYQQLPPVHPLTRQLYLIR